MCPVWRDSAAIASMSATYSCLHCCSIYEKLIQYCGIDEFGTNLSPDVFDPHEWGEESYYEELSKAQREHEAKKQKEKLAQQKTQV